MARPDSVRIFIQARMSSSRFPGKVLAPFQGKPIIRHVVEAVSRALPRPRIVVATSTAPSDDPLAAYLQGMGVQVFRGPLDDVFRRFQLCQRRYPCEWFVRVCADSPMLDPKVLKTVLSRSSGADYDLITNVFPRSFPRGCSVEMLSSKTFRRIRSGRLTPSQREHVTRYYYDNPSRFRILNIESARPLVSQEDLVVDTLEDLRRLEAKAAGTKAA